MWRALPWEPDDYDEVTETVIGRGAEDPVSNASATSFWQLAVKSTDEEKVGRDFSNAAVHVALGSIPGMFGLSPPGPAAPFARYWPTTVDRKHITQMIHMGELVEPVPETEPSYSTAVDTLFVPIPEPPRGPTRRAPLGAIIGTRSGDKGGSANLGVFTRSGPAYAWIAATLTVDRLRELIPETAELAIDRYELPNLWALNFVIHGLLGEGVSSSLRVDPQAKGLGEFLRARHVEMPIALLEEAY